MLQGSRDIASKILLEEVPSARHHLAPIIEALRQNHPVSFDYHPYNRSQPSRDVVIEPYFLRIYRQLWYVTARNTADGKIKTYSLDRITNLKILPEVFTPPADTDPVEYFRDSFGIMVTQAKPKTIKLKVDQRQAKYFRALPLHPSQQEMLNDKYSIFTYHLRITPRPRGTAAELRSRRHRPLTPRTARHAPHRPPRHPRQLHHPRTLRPTTLTSPVHLPPDSGLTML